MISAQRYKDRVCLITGGTSGIGFEIAKRMAEEGGSVVVCSVDKDWQEKVAELKKAGDVHGLPCDVTIKEQRLAVIKFVEDKFHRIDVLCLNAGIAGYKGV